MQNKNNIVRGILFGIVLLVLIGGFTAHKFYQRIWGPAVQLDSVDVVDFYIHSDATFDSVFLALERSQWIKDAEAFRWVAEKKNYPAHIRPGHYILKDQMSNNALVNLLRSGKQQPVRVVFNNVRTLSELAGRVAQQLEADSLAFMQAFTNTTLIQELGYTPATFPALFIPNTYELWWNTSPEQFVRRMQTEHDRFWNEQRMRKARKLGMLPSEVSTLAAIVDEETYRDDEMPTIAGVYINRLKKGIPLQADPTVKFAMGDVTMKRVWKKHLAVESPYNTYKNAGLPPGPIRIPSIAAVEAVLNYEDHGYYYFCAKDDFSGYHAFAKTLRQHNRNAQRYQRALNEQRIWK
ncbi:MAG: endolytic transglycosylase MltG [Bacteroidota bacterium]